MLIRQYQASDAEAIAQLYRDSVQVIGATAYNAEQVAVWSAYPQDLEQFRTLLGIGLTLVAVEDTQFAAFGQLHPLNHIAFLYTASRYGKKGYATAIYQQLEAYAKMQGCDRLTTEASRISKFFFLKMGFAVVEPEMVERQGVQFERFKMEKQLG
ncbi:GNAT family N-acetyltransferase [Desertifilum sp. FACHB-1129]|uniref:GNAT family N-acetyltransferase n=1 Tax=Desertifilum tharense IPPAS B-1220 TaxID=1781255 RepID=A0A1E5QL20_9CYAN|nr:MULTISPECIES: GNAT family N-acetyltransferase [Desertifilum]MDA0212833.1 GNAT family N-acetyltransferase [Cyanobacteria bacterium FC1]MBD2314461.1 GNAT family N-acetyltransferase [Desertifilum sp. FACHB-1129]MBD2321710.1 GNAT family N-acetyltransferase [Desertifilum sp. FACHB-866]MBD2331837.1 GNAT family N-acetyltransferase [Desertifilum sp. FACHB-868]OEJ75375.1 GNAT family N-acetyltransferase [Desertifilum tharense IPPAS B-1220]